MATTPAGLNYIRQQLALGMTNAQIAAALAQGGWSAEDIAQSLAAVESPAPPPPVPQPIPAPAPVSTPAPVAAPTPTLMQAMDSAVVTPPVSVPTPVNADLDVGLPSMPMAAAPAPDMPRMVVPPVAVPLSVVRRRHPLRLLAWIVFILILLGIIAAGAYAYEAGKLPLIEQYAARYLPFLAPHG
jgi:hypothetical protein